MAASTTYADALEHLAQLGPELAPASPGAPPRKFDLAGMRALMAALGNPQRSFASVLIAGTNGKGSTAATLASILSSAGLRTALYTSPHLVRVNERIQLSSPVTPTEYASVDVPATLGPIELHPIADEDLARLYFRVDSVGTELVEQETLPHSPSFFERLTAVAFLYFAERHAEIAVLEVGLGGRLDATNIVDPLLSVITDIALDHQEYLGSTLADIAREKAGILRPNGTLITLPQHGEVNQTFGEIAAATPGLRAISAAPFIPPAVRNGDEPSRSSAAPDHAVLAHNRYFVPFEGSLLQVDSPLPGHHQQRNIALAIAAAAALRKDHGYRIPETAIEAGILHTHWPGRLETVPLDPHHQLLLDVAHNPAGAWTLRAAIAQLPPTQPRTLIFSCLRDKDLGEMTRILFPLFDSSSSDPDRRHDHIILAPIDNPRTTGLNELLNQAELLEVPAHAAPHLHAALAQARETTPTGGLIIATGSVYLVGEIRHILLPSA